MSREARSAVIFIEAGSKRERKGLSSPSRVVSRRPSHSTKIGPHRPSLSPELTIIGRRASQLNDRGGESLYTLTTMSRSQYRAPPSSRPSQPYTSSSSQPPSPSSRSPKLQSPRWANFQRAREESAESYGMSETRGGGGAAHGVASGAIGASYGPYSGTHGQYSALRSPMSSSSHHHAADRPARVSSRYSEGTETLESHSHSKHGTAQANYKLSPHQTAMQWSSRDAELDDYMHNPSPHDALIDKRAFTLWSGRGWMNMTALVLILGALVTFFAGYPIIAELTRPKGDRNGAWNLGGINSTGQVPSMNNLASMIDAFTPENVRTRTGFDGQQYELVFSGASSLL